MKKKLALMLAAVTTVATLFTGCGKKDISGDYVANVKLAQFMEESDLQDMEDLGIDIGDLSLDCTLDLTKDGDFTFAFDTTNFKSEFTALLEDNMDSLLEQAIGYSKDELTDEDVQYLGYDSVDALFEDLGNEVMSQMDTYYESMDEELEDCKVTGTYKVSKDSVVLVSEDGDDVSFEEGTINDDGSISLKTEYDGQDFTLEFKPQ